ncbi:MAG: sialidase family protein [bacterium]|nr:sialidase family protein [bacterium]
MNENRRGDPRQHGDDDTLGDALGEAVSRETDSPVVTPPVTDIAERAAARAKARRVRHGVVSIAAAAALIAGGLAAWNTLGGDGDGNILVATQPTVTQTTESASTGGDPAASPVAVPEKESATPAPQPTDPPPPDPQPTDPPPPDPQPADPPTAEVAEEPEDPDPGSAVPDPSSPTPEKLSTGSTLTWIEVSVEAPPGIFDIYQPVSVGDGRIFARAWGETGDQIVVTDDGTTWTSVPTPAGIAPGLIDIAGARWVVAGVDASGAERTDRVFFSDDEGVTWTELALELAPEPVPGAPYCVEYSRVQSALASDDRIVVVIDSYTDLDLQALLVERGYAPDTESILGLHHTERALIVRVGDGSTTERLEIAHDELGLAPGQPQPCAGQDGRYGQLVHVLTSDGTHTEEVRRYGGRGAAALKTADGFSITLSTHDGGLLLTSQDGRTWTERPISEQGYVPVTRGPDGAAWRSVWNFGSYRIERLAAGGDPGTVAEFGDLLPGQVLTAGPAGVVATASPISAAGSDYVPDIRIAKDGYELRLNQRWGGLALWDLATGVAVYQFGGAEMMLAAEPPDGLRMVIENDGSTTIVFEDPDTGADLVAFTDGDLELAAAELPADPGPFEPPPTWIGWSTDGDAWGWQSLNDAFEIDTGDTSPHVELAVGEDFVLALVLLATGSESQPSASPSPDARWFIAPVP